MDASDGRRGGNITEVKCLNEAFFPKKLPSTVVTPRPTMRHSEKTPPSKAKTTKEEQKWVLEVFLKMLLYLLCRPCKHLETHIQIIQEGYSQTK